jgi:type I restriction enzyme S subunit
MSYLDKLLEGVEVEWKTLGEVGEFIRGNGLQKVILQKVYPAFIMDKSTPFMGTLHMKQNHLFHQLCLLNFAKAQKGDIIIATTSENIEDVCKPLVWLGEEEVCVSGETYILKHNQNPKYIAYYLQTPIFFDYKKSIKQVQNICA